MNTIPAVRLSVFAIIALLASGPTSPAQTATNPALSPSILASNASTKAPASKQTLVAANRSETTGFVSQPKPSSTVSTATCCDTPGTGYTISPFSVNDIYADAIIYPFSNPGNSGTIIRIGGGSTDTIYTIYTGTNPAFVGTVPYNVLPISSGFNLCFSFTPTTAWSWDVAANNPGEDLTAPGSGNILNAGTATVGLIYKACNAGSGWIIKPPTFLYGSTGNTPATIIKPIQNEDVNYESCAISTAVVPGAMPGMAVVASPSLAFPRATIAYQLVAAATVSAANTVTVTACQLDLYYSGGLPHRNTAVADPTWYNVTVTPY